MKLFESYKNIGNKIREAVISDKPRTRVLFYAISITLAFTSFVMTVINYFTKEYILLLATLIFSLLCLLNIVLMYCTRIFEKIVYSAFAVETAVLLLFFIISGIPNGFSVLWVCLIPNFTMLVFGLKKGSLFSILTLFVMMFLFWIPFGRSLLLYRYTNEFMLRFPFLYISMFVIALVIELIRRETQKQLENAKQEYNYLYQHDALTGLYNRYGIKAYIENAFSDKTADHISAILFDIDNFKSINDKYGHEFGDLVLKTVASVPVKIMCKHCKCCRWGGEEFLLVMQCEHDAVAVAEKIKNEISKMPIMFGDQAVHITVSIGICIAKNLSGISFHDVVDTADRALYRSKADGKNTVTVTELGKTPE